VTRGPPGPDRIASDPDLLSKGESVLSGSKRGAAVAATAAACLLGGAGVAFGWPFTDRGPSTRTDPYVIPVADGVSTVSLLTVDDPGKASNGYDMAGIPDGLGAVKASGRTFTLFANQEIAGNLGAVRRHGQPGAFVSKWTIDKRTLEVVAGSDLIDPGVALWDPVAQTYTTTAPAGGPNPRNPGDTFPAASAAFSRFCSSTLTAPKQLWNRRSGRGYEGQIYFGNEESGDNGRVIGITTDGTAQELPRLGKASWENTKHAYNRSDTTLVAGLEDGGQGQLWIHRGVKRRAGSPFDRAGLTNGSEFVIDADNAAVTNDAQFRAAYPKGTPAAVSLNTVDWDQSGTRQNAEAVADGLSLNRIEDGSWDPSNPNDFYFLTTVGGATSPNPAEPTIARDGGGLWKLSFEDIEQPDLGATLTLVLDGSEAPYLNNPDNLDIDRDGHVLIQEDTGNSAHVGRIVAYDIESGRRGVMAAFDPERFTPGRPKFITQDEEASGIIDASAVLGRDWFLFDAQVHKASANPAHVELGQFLAMHVDDWRAVFDG
jgi:hypothetical protein